MLPVAYCALTSKVSAEDLGEISDPLGVQEERRPAVDPRRDVGPRLGNFRDDVV